MSSAATAFVACKKTTPNASTAKVVGGSAAANDLLPFVVSLFVVGPSDDGKRGFIGVCSGAIVRDDLVMTAAHCFVDVNGDGVLVRDRTGGPLLARRLYSKDHIIMPGYPKPAEKHGQVEASETQALNSDVAFAVFDKGTFAPPYIGTFSQDSPVVGQQVELIGYGETSPNDPNSNDQINRYQGTNTISNVAANFAGVVTIDTLTISSSTVGGGSGDSGTPLLSSSGQIMGVLHGSGGLGTSTDVTITSADINGQNGYRTFFVNAKDQGVAAFISAVMNADAPTATTGGDGKPTPIAVVSSLNQLDLSRSQ